MAIYITNESSSIKVTNNLDIIHFYNKYECNFSKVKINNDTFLSISDNEEANLYNINDITTPSNTGISNLLDILNSYLTNDFTSLNSNLVSIKNVVIDNKKNSNYLLLARQYQIPGHEIKVVNSRRRGIDNNNFYDIFEGQTTSINKPTGNNQLQVSSSNANDNLTGTGARKVKIEGYLLDGTFQEETVNLNGLTAVNTTYLYHRISRAYVSEAGTQLYNIGDIYIGYGTVTSGVNSLPIRKLAATFANEFSSQIYIPNNHIGTILDFSIKGNYTNASNSTDPYAYQLKQLTSNNVEKTILLNETNEIFKLSQYICPSIIGPSDIWIMGKALVNDTIDIFASMTVLIVQL